MADDPLVAASALKHGIAAEDILHGYRNPIRAYDLDDGFTMLIGPAAEGDLSRSASCPGPTNPSSFMQCALDPNSSREG